MRQDLGSLLQSNGNGRQTGHHPLEYQAQLLLFAEITGHKQGRVLALWHDLTFVENFRYKLGAEVSALKFMTDPKESQGYTKEMKLEVFFTVYERHQLLLDTIVGLLRHRDLVESARERTLVRVVKALDTLNAKAAVTKAVKMLQIFVQTDGDMGVMKTHP